MQRLTFPFPFVYISLEAVTSERTYELKVRRNTKTSSCNVETLMMERLLEEVKVMSEPSLVFWIRQAVNLSFGH